MYSCERWIVGRMFGPSCSRCSVCCSVAVSACFFFCQGSCFSGPVAVRPREAPACSCPAVMRVINAGACSASTFKHLPWPGPGRAWNRRDVPARFPRKFTGRCRLRKSALSWKRLEAILLFKMRHIPLLAANSPIYSPENGSSNFSVHPPFHRLPVGPPLVLNFFLRSRPDFQFRCSSQLT